MKDHAEKIDLGAFERLGNEEVVALEEDAGADGCGLRAEGSGARGGVLGEVLHYEV